MEKRGNYEHQGTPKMEQMTNKLTLPSDQEKQNKLMDLATTSSVPTDSKGKRKVGQDPMITSTNSPSTKNLKLFKDPFLQIVDYPTPTMEIDREQEVDIEKTLLDHCGSLKLQAGQEREIIEER